MPRKSAKDTPSQARARERKRNWTFIVYPESAPEDWRSIIMKNLAPWIESPLHDADENADGEQKKEHWHILMLFENPKHYDEIVPITKSVNASLPQIVASAKGLVRYMAHLDNPEKKQYDPALIIGHGDVDVPEYLKPAKSARYTQIVEMMNWVDENNCKAYWKLLRYAANERQDDWFHLLCDSCSFVMTEYIKSKAMSNPETKVYKVDPETGEILE